MDIYNLLLEFRLSNFPFKRTKKIIVIQGSLLNCYDNCSPYQQQQEFWILAIRNLLRTLHNSDKNIANRSALKNQRWTSQKKKKNFKSLNFYIFITTESVFFCSQKFYLHLGKFGFSGCSFYVIATGVLSQSEAACHCQVVGRHGICHKHYTNIKEGEHSSDKDIQNEHVKEDEEVENDKSIFFSEGDSCRKGTVLVS